MLIVVEVEENIAFKKNVERGLGGGKIEKKCFGGVGGGMCLQNAKLASWLCLFTFKFGNLVEYKQS